MEAEVKHSWGLSPDQCWVRRSEQDIQEKENSEQGFQSLTKIAQPLFNIQRKKNSEE